jgi:hypothetical protein
MNTYTDYRQNEESHVEDAGVNGLDKIIKVLSNAVTFELNPSLVIKNHQGDTLCVINNDENFDINVMTYQDLTFVFTTEEAFHLNAFLQSGIEISNKIKNLIAQVSVLHFPTTNHIDLERATITINANGINIVIIHNYKSNGVLNNKVLILTESSTKGKSIANVRIDEFSKYLELNISPAFFKPNNAIKRVKRVRMKGTHGYLTSDISPKQIDIDDLHELIDINNDTEPSRRWIQDANNAIMDFGRDLDAQTANKSAILSKCLNTSIHFDNKTLTNNTGTNYDNNRKTKYTSDYVNDYVYDPRDFDGSFTENRNNNNEIEMQIKKLTSFNRDVLKCLHFMNLTEMKNLYENTFDPSLKPILDHFDNFGDFAIEDIRNILKSCNVV